MGIRNQIGRFCQTLKSIDYIEHLITGVIIGGIIGGLIFAMLSPFIVPPLQDAVIKSSVGPSPSPDMRMMYEDQTSYTQIHSPTNISVNSSQYRIFYVVLGNPTNKLITDLNLLFLFSGCPKNSDILFTSLDSAVSSPNSDDIETKELVGGCGAEISVEELPPQKWANVYFVVNTTETNNQIDRDLDQREVAILGNYEWQYNGRMYFSKIENVVTVQDEMENGDKLN